MSETQASLDAKTVDYFPSVFITAGQPLLATKETITISEKNFLGLFSQEKFEKDGDPLITSLELPGVPLS